MSSYGIVNEQIMIEKCTKKRMLISVALLIGLSVAIVLLEHHLTQSSHYTSHFHANYSGNQTGTQCWLTEKITVLEDCHPCTEFEKNSQSVGSCVATGYKEKVRCETSGDTSRSCERVLWLEERRFWTLEIVSLVLGLVSSTFVMWRQRLLERQSMQKLQKQINI